MPTIQPSLWDLSCALSTPSVETLGYSRLSLRDKDLARFRKYSLGSNPSGIGHSCPSANCITFYFLRCTRAATFKRSAFSLMKPVASSWLYALVGSASMVAMAGL